MLFAPRPAMTPAMWVRSLRPTQKSGTPSTSSTTASQLPLLLRRLLLLLLLLPLTTTTTATTTTTTTTTNTTSTTCTGALAAAAAPTLLLVSAGYHYHQQQYNCCSRFYRPLILLPWPMEELLPHLLKAYWQTARRKSISLQTSHLEDDEYEDGVRYWS